MEKSKINQVIFYTKQIVFDAFKPLLENFNIECHYKTEEINYIMITRNKRYQNELLFFDYTTLIKATMINQLPKQKYIVFIDQLNLQSEAITGGVIGEALKNANSILYFQDDYKDIFHKCFSYTKHFHIVKPIPYICENKQIDILCLYDNSQRNQQIISLLTSDYNIVCCNENEIDKYIDQTKMLILLRDEKNTNYISYENMYKINYYAKKRQCYIISEVIIFNDDIKSYYECLYSTGYFYGLSGKMLNLEDNLLILRKVIDDIIGKSSNIVNLLMIDALKSIFDFECSYSSQNIYNFALNYNYCDTVHCINEVTKSDNNGKYFLKYLEFLKNSNTTEKQVIKLDKISNSCVCTIFDRHPHIEHTIVNVIKMFNEQQYSWKNVVICGKHNINYVSQICKRITSCFDNLDIHIIQMDIFENNLHKINKMFYSQEFWKQIPGNTLFVYNGNFNKWNLKIDDILGYNFVVDRNTNSPMYSLRIKDHMIDILNKYKLHNLKFEYNNILDFMNKNKMLLPPESVYFSNVYLQNQYGTVRFKN